MNINDIKERCPNMFTEENMKYWQTKVEAEPNQLNIFILSGVSGLEWDNKDENGRTYSIKVFCEDSSRVEGIVQPNIFNYSSLQDALNVRNSITATIIKKAPTFNGMGTFEQYMLDDPGIGVFRSPDGIEVRIDLATI